MDAPVFARQPLAGGDPGDDAALEKCEEATGPRLLALFFGFVRQGSGAFARLFERSRNPA